MDIVDVKLAEEFSEEKYLKESPIKTDKIAFTVYNFKPWQSLPMHKNPNNDTLMYVVEGQGIMLVNDENRSVVRNSAIYIPANSTYGFLAGENDMVTIMVQGPTPVESVFQDDLAYDCPVCKLDVPVTTNTFDGCVTVCPRCNVKLKLMKGDKKFNAEETREQAPTQAWIS